ncbi:MAG: hypothetical protein AABY22_19585, partial [Nanoarchaeota archaeon]
MEQVKEWSLEEIVSLLNLWQGQGMLKITNYENLTISLRQKLEKEISGTIEEWIEEYTKLWQGKRSIDGYYLAQPASQNAARMLKFCKEHPQFTSDIIIKAAEKYIQE